MEGISSNLLDIQKKLSIKEGTPSELREEKRKMIDRGKVVPNSPISENGQAKKTVEAWRTSVAHIPSNQSNKKSRRRTALQSYVDERKREYGSMDFNSALSKSSADKYLKDSYDFSCETHGDRYILHKKHTFSFL
jgi:hypothetical protein